MGKLRIKRPKDAQAAPRELEQSLRRQMAWAAGTEYFQNRDLCTM